MNRRLFLKKLKTQINSQQGRNTLTFLIFLAISAMFWLLMSMNDEIQRDYELPITISDLPSDVTLLNSSALPVISVSVKDRGVNLISHRFMGRNKLNIPYKDLADDNNRLSLSETQLNTTLRQYFGTNATIISHSPDSISIAYTTSQPYRLPISLDITVKTNQQHIVNGKILTSTDTVSVFGISPLPDSISSIKTFPIQLRDLSDTLSTIVYLHSPTGFRVIPDHISITIPVEPLISKTISVPVEVVGYPEGKKIITFPSSVDFTCLVPMSIFNREIAPIKAYADYTKRQDNIMELDLSMLPDNYINGSVSPKSVEYIIEEL